MHFHAGVRNTARCALLRPWFAALLGLCVHFDPAASSSCPAVCRCDGTFVYCNERGLTSVPLGVQEGSKTLFLQNNLINNGGFPAELHAVASVDFVSLYGNRLDEFPLNLPRNVRTLHLQENSIQTVSRRALGQLRLLEELHLDDNSISTVGVEEGAFREARGLRLLFLTKNHLSGVPAGLPAHLTELRLDENRIVAVTPGDFRDVGELQRVVLDGNLLEDGAIAEGAFQDLGNLKELSLARNSLTAPPASLPHSLARLFLQENRIQHVPVSAFSGLARLEKLDLSGNLLQTLPQGVFQGLRSLTHLNARGNQWSCDCALWWLALWLRSLPSSTSVKGFTCHLPVRLRGAVIRELSADTLECPGGGTASPGTLPKTSPPYWTAAPRVGTASAPSTPGTPTFQPPPPTTAPPPPPLPRFIPNFPPPYEDPLKMFVLGVNSTSAEVAWESYFSVEAYKVTWARRSPGSVAGGATRERTVPGHQRRLGLRGLQPGSDYRVCVYVLDTLNSYRPGEDAVCADVRTRAAPRAPGSGPGARQGGALTWVLAGAAGGAALIVLVALLVFLGWHVRGRGGSDRGAPRWRRKDDYGEAGTKKDNSILEVGETSFQIDFGVLPGAGIGYRDCHHSNSSLAFCKGSDVPGVDFCLT